MNPLARTPRRRLAIAGVSVALALTVTACGGDDTEDTAAGGDDSAAPSAPATEDSAVPSEPSEPATTDAPTDDGDDDGDDDGEGDTGSDPATADFCEEFEALTEDLNAVGEADDDSDAAEAANEFADELGDVELPAAFSDDARAGLMIYAEFLGQVTAADVADLRNAADLAQVFGDDLPQVQAFIVETGEACFAPAAPSATP